MYACVCACVCVCACAFIGEREKVCTESGANGEKKSVPRKKEVLKVFLMKRDFVASEGPIPPHLTPGACIKNHYGPVAKVVRRKM